MSQNLFRDPIVSVAPALVGVGNGTVSIDRLTHFTIQQTYTLTCIAKTPDTLFAVTGSLDGPVGIAVVGTQFYDEDLKVFFTIQQGSTPFEIGDIFTFEVTNGTDLNQDNIDDYDELPQKNFGLGTKGFNEGDHNLRYLPASVQAYRFIGDVKYTAVTAGNSGNSIQIQYLPPVPAVSATLVKQDLTYTATAGAAGNNISVEYVQYTAAAKASLSIQNLFFIADSFGAAGNNISIELTSGATAGSEIVSVLSTAISVQIEDGVSTALQIKTAIDAFPAAAALVDTSFVGPSSTPQVIYGPTFLVGGVDSFGEAGNEQISVVGTDVTVTLESGVSTATQVKAALEGYGPFTSLNVSVTVSGVGSNFQTAPDAQEFLSGGANSYGYVGNETIQVVGNLIKIYFENARSTALQIKTAFDLSVAATTLAAVTIIGFSSAPQYNPLAAVNLLGGKNKYFSFNHEELTDSGSFVEGNASVKAQDARLLGQLEVSGHSSFKESVSLQDATASNNSGPSIGNAQQTINSLVQDQKITLRTANNETKLTWVKPDLSFVDNIIIDLNDTGFSNTLLASNSPITLSDGESLYVILDRLNSSNLSPLVGSTIPQNVNCFRIATRHGDNLRLWDNTLLRDNKSVRIGEGGSGSGITKVTFFDPVSTIMPTGPAATFDNVAAVNKDLVVFTGLTNPSENNIVYEINGVGTSITFTAIATFETGVNPSSADLIIIQKGDAFKNQIAEYDGISFKVNPYTRYFNGADYFEMSSLQTASIVNNSTGTIFSVAYSGSENMIVEFSVLRGTAKKVGTIHITTDGTNVSRAVVGADISDIGVDFQASIVGPNLLVEYVADNSGSSGTMKYFVRRWSNLAGGPAGLPSYSTGGGFAAAGSTGDIQFNSGGTFAADSDLNYDSTNNILSLGNVKISGLSGALVLLDNQLSAVTSFTYDKTLYPSAILEFSIVRDGNRETGRMLISTNGTDVGYSTDSASTLLGGLGIALSAVIVGSDVAVQYTSSSTGFNGSLKYSFRRWS